MDENHVVYANTEDRIPVFLSKLWTILENPEHSSIVCWDESGFSFHIIDQFAFSKNVLPRYFKHNNLNSLVRQLNMYGFRKMTPLERAGGSSGRNYDDQLEFSHPYFIRGKAEYLKFIKRKASGKKESGVGHAAEESGNGSLSQTMVKVPAKDLNAVLQEVKQLREKQNRMSERMTLLSEQNETLWNEVGVVRAKHKKQEQIVNKLVQFLVALVNPSTSPSKRLPKRPMLAIEETVPSKQRRTSSGNSSNSSPFGINVNDNNNIHEILERLQREISTDSNHVQNMNSQFVNSRSQSGPVIAEMENDELDVPPLKQSSISPMNRRTQPMSRNVNPQVQPQYGGYQQIVRNPVMQSQPQVSNNSRSANRIFTPAAPQFPEAKQQIPVMQPPSNSAYVVQQRPVQVPQPQINQEVAIPSTSQQLQLRSAVTTPAPNNFDLDASDDYANFSEVIVPNEFHLEEPVTFSSNVDPLLASELSDYLCGMDQQIDNCRGMIGSNWDNDDYDLGLGNMDYNPQQLMLEGPRNSEEPPTPQLLTPTGGSPVNDHLLGHGLEL
ncbi:hypothetical protein QR680_011233 [Steinernema hermaphroditum]|uniref:HSF-type DNA-binding domain-containing protein n=1 Tax=Steinernema hermaphroditum TaxID=289476 RepID=A0AA39ITC0_9BILA|nr:hypothetical protein QR680_011233 [Steinernema hermaphroditum]